MVSWGVFHLLICILWIWVVDCIWNKRIKWSMVFFVRLRQGMARCDKVISPVGLMVSQGFFVYW